METFACQNLSQGQFDKVFPWTDKNICLISDCTWLQFVGSVCNHILHQLKSSLPRFEIFKLLTHAQTNAHTS